MTATMGPVNVISLKAGEAVFQQGDSGDLMYIVKTGQIDLLINGNVIETVGPGGILGELTLIDKKLRGATARSRTVSELLAVNEGAFNSMLKQTPTFALMVMRIMAKRLRGKPA